MCGGNSGGPVWVVQAGKRSLIGVVRSDNKKINNGKRISTRVYAFIQRAMEVGG